MRKAARSTPAGTGRASPATSSVTSRPAARVRSTSPDRSRSPAVGARGAVDPSSLRRSTSSTDRNSPSASLLASLMAASAGRAWSGRSSSRWRAPPPPAPPPPGLGGGGVPPPPPPLPADADDLARRAHEGHPGDASEGLPQLGCRLVRERPLQPGEGGGGGDQHAPDERPPAHDHGAHHGEDEGRESPRAPRVAGGRVPGGGGERHGQRRLGPAPAEHRRLPRPR